MAELKLFLRTTPKVDGLKETLIGLQTRNSIATALKGLDMLWACASAVELPVDVVVVQLSVIGMLCNCHPRPAQIKFKPRRTMICIC
mmetsp:Transcript_46499/g.81860  ORF Transcript_46499/g.81860 Transcript_46499/m.81860 type:complete len:87 (+) Transcript_46499:545-805(+)